MNHGLPQKCLEEDFDSKTVASHNTSHMMVRTVISKECIKYKDLMEDCKSECLEDEPKGLRRLIIRKLYI